MWVALTAVLRSIVATTIIDDFEILSCGSGKGSVRSTGNIGTGTDNGNGGNDSRRRG